MIYGNKTKQNKDKKQEKGIELKIEFSKERVDKNLRIFFFFGKQSIARMGNVYFLFIFFLFLLNFIWGLNLCFLAYFYVYPFNLNSHYFFLLYFLFFFLFYFFIFFFLFFFFILYFICFECAILFTSFLFDFYFVYFIFGGNKKNTFFSFFVCSFYGSARPI